MNNGVPTYETFISDFPEFATVSQAEYSRIYKRANVLFFSDSPATAINLLACELLIAHMIYLQNKANSGGQGGLNIGGFVQSASVHDVSVSVAAMPTKDNLQYWLSLTPYGQELLGMIDALPPIQYHGGSNVQVLK